MKQALNLPDGVALVQVSPRGPADRAGLQAFRRGNRGELIQGDVITHVADQPVKNLDDLLGVLERRQAGDVVSLGVWNKGQNRKVAVTLVAGE